MIADFGSNDAPDDRQLHRLNLRVPFDLYERMLENKPKYVNCNSFSLQLIDQALTICYENGGMTLGSPIGLQKSIDNCNIIRTRSASQEQKGSAVDSKAVQAVPSEENFDIPFVPTELVDERSEAGLSSDAPAEIVPAKKKEQKSQSIPIELTDQTELIREYWKIKPKGKTNTCWNLLIRELLKIKENAGSEELNYTIESAINGKWQGITYRNHVKYNSSEGKSGPVKSTRKPTLIEKFKTEYGVDFS